MESPMRACVVHSQDVDSVDAVAELIAGAKVALGASLPRGVPAAGFYGYGEIARLAKDGISHYHNETFTTLLLGDRVGSA